MASPAASAAKGWNSASDGGIFKMIRALAGCVHILDSYTKEKYTGFFKVLVLLQPLSDQLEILVFAQVEAFW